MEKKRVLIISVSGIGNTILQSPFINAVLDSDLYETDILFGNHAISSVYSTNRLIRNIYILPPSLLQSIGLLWKLRKNPYDYCVNCFPSNRVEFAILQAFVRARIRLSHRYAFGRLRTLACIYNKSVDALSGLHDVEQNLNLLAALELPKPEEVRVSYDLSESNIRFSDHFKKSLDKRKKIIGIHPGSGPLEEKRWPMDRFLRVVESLKPDFNIIVFGSRAETDPFIDIQGIRVCTGELSDVASVIGVCDFFLSADTGLMHVASVFGIQQFVLWGPTSFTRTRPWNPNVVYFGRTDLDLLKYPFGDTKSRFLGEHPEKYMEEITSDEVIREIRSWK
ncbi:glycosyltransferase family 9 protein [Leptospira wolffii]|uniref:Glycosyltransferase family 9 protein n=1 Tax=Leptospira wolffii TaxID=409998 RepID=A0ABV5BKB9_9LEPT